jgi:hypothetical protein
MPFIGRRRGDSTIEEKWSTVSGVIQCFHLGKKRGRVALFQKGKGSCEVALDSRTDGQPKDLEVEVGRHLN